MIRRMMPEKKARTERMWSAQRIGNPMPIMPVENPEFIIEKWRRNKKVNGC
jgi:hypothetical protein